MSVKKETELAYMELKKKNEVLEKENAEF